MPRSIPVWGLALALATSPLACDGCDERSAPKPPTAQDIRKRGVVDTHLHASYRDMDRLIALMDAQGIAWGLNLSGTWPGAILEENIAAAKESGRLVVACNLPWAAARRFRNFPELAVELLRESHRLGARALKVEKALGLAARRPDGKLLAVDDPWLDPIWKTAGELGLPVVIHTGDPKAFWLPVDENNERFEELNAHPGWSNYGLPLPSFDELLEQLMNVVERHPETTFVSVHFGNNAEDPTWVGRMLDTHPNLYVDVAARLPEIGRHPAEEVRRVFMKHQDRILFGTDTGLGGQGFLMLGSFGEEPNSPEEIGPYFRAHWRWFETRDTFASPTPIQGRWDIHGIGLPPEILAKIYRANAEKLFGGPQKASAPTSTPTATSTAPR